MGVGLFVGLAIFGRLVGVPDSWKNRFVRELSLRGLEVETRKLTIDPLGGLVARDLVVYRDAGRKEERLRIGRVELNLNWLSWRAGEPILSGARLRDANVAWPLGEGVEVEARRVEAAIEFRPDEIRIQRLRGQVLGFDLDLQGRVGTEMGRMVPPQAMPLASIWRSLEKALQDLGGPAPKIQAEFDLEIGRPEESRAEILMIASRNVWKGVALRQVELRATMAGGGIKLEKFRIGLERGEVEVVGWAELQAGRGGVEYTASTDLAQWAPAAGKLGPALADLRSQAPPQITGKMEFAWKESPSFLWQSRLELGEFRLGRTLYQSLVFPWVSDGKQWMVQGLKLEAGAGGSLLAQLAFDGKAKVIGTLNSNLDPKGLALLFGPGAGPFWKSIDFATPPKIEAKVTGASLTENLWRVEGRLAGGGVKYKGVELDEIMANFVWGGNQVVVTDLQVSSGGGRGGGEFIYELSPESVLLKNIVATLPVQKVAPIFGEKFVTNMRPYIFVDRPTITLNGKVDLEEKGRSDMRATVVSKEGMDYGVAGRNLRFTDLNMTVEIVGKKVLVKTIPKMLASVLGGKVEVEVEVESKGKGSETHQMTRARMKQVGFGPLVETYFGNTGYAGEMSGSFFMEGPSKDWRNWEGSGKLTVEDGVLPGMGAFAQAMNAPAEWVGATGQEADMEFALKKGKLDVGQLQITSLMVVTTGRGVYDIANDQLENFIMRQNLRGPAGVPFFFVSQIFQVEGSGSLKNPVWKARNFEE
jgi:hypothetical protein